MTGHTGQKTSPMKNIINILLMGACFLCSSVFATADPDSFCLRVEGKVLNAGLQGASGCTIELLCDGRSVEKLVVPNARKKFSFDLVKNRQYSLKMSQSGYIDKVVTINTELPVFFEDDYGFFFETSLLEEKHCGNFNRDVLLLPVARISWDMKRHCFYYDKEYSENIKKEMLTKR